MKNTVMNNTANEMNFKEMYELYEACDGPETLDKDEIEDEAEFVSEHSRSEGFSKLTDARMDKKRSHSKRRKSTARHKRTYKQGHQGYKECSAEHGTRIENSGILEQRRRDNKYPKSYNVDKDFVAGE